MSSVLQSSLRRGGDGEEEDKGEATSAEEAGKIGHRLCLPLL